MSGQAQLSYLSQMTGITGLQVVTPMMGLALAVATLPLMQAAGGYLAHIEYIERDKAWECVRITLQPREPGAEPLDLALWFSRPDVQRDFWRLFAIVPWEDDNWRRPWREFDTYFHLVDPLHPPDPHPP